jgi:outer membrane lipoprotein
MMDPWMFGPRPWGYGYGGWGWYNPALPKSETL